MDDTFARHYPEVRIAEKQFNAVVCDDVAEASDLGLPAGVWPDALIVGTLRWLRGPKLPAVHGEFSGYYYELATAPDVRLTVFND